LGAMWLGFWGKELTHGGGVPYIGRRAPYWRAGQAGEAARHAIGVQLDFELESGSVRRDGRDDRWVPPVSDRRWRVSVGAALGHKAGWAFGR
jgi:hypothetical protein